MTTEDAVSAARQEVWRAVKRYRNSSSRDVRETREDEIDDCLDTLIQAVEQRGREAGLAEAQVTYSGTVREVEAQVAVLHEAARRAEGLIRGLALDAKVVPYSTVYPELALLQAALNATND